MEDLQVRATRPVYKTDEQGNLILENGKKVLDGEPREASVVRQFPTTTGEAVEMFGESMLLELARDEFKVRLQNYMRRMLDAENSDEAIQEAAMAWYPGMKTEVKLDPIAAFRKAMDSADPAKREEILRTFKEQYGL